MNSPTQNLKTVAKALGVSTATISNAFNRPDQLSATLRDKILKACSELGYHGPNQAARSLRKGRSGIVAVVLSDTLDYMVSDPVASQFIRGVARTLEQHQQHMLLFSGSHERLDAIVDFVDGFILYGAPRNANLIEQLRKTHKKVLAVDCDLAGRASVNIDNEQAAYDIARSVLTPNSRVAVLGLRLIDDPNVQQVAEKPLLDVQSSIAIRRLTGYQRAMQTVGLPLSGKQIWHIPHSSQTVAEQAVLAALEQKPNVLLCMSDIIALSAMRVLLERGIRVPDDIQVVGFDGIEEAARYHPSLTTVCQGSDAKGERAVLAFLQDNPESQWLPYQIRQGKSSVSTIKT